MRSRYIDAEEDAEVRKAMTSQNRRRGSRSYDCFALVMAHVRVRACTREYRLAERQRLSEHLCRGMPLSRRWTSNYRGPDTARSMP